MKKLEAFFGIIVAIGFFATALVAITNLGSLIFKGTPEHVTRMAAHTPETPTEAAALAATETAAPQAAVQVAAAAPAVSAAGGEKVFKKCKACHSVEQGGAHKTGPNLWSIVGKAVAATPDFAYSDAMTAEGGKVWDVAMLDSYLSNPKQAIPGNKMSFAGLKKAEDRNNLIAFLAQNADTPQSPAELGFAAPAAGAEVIAAAATVEDEVVEIDPVPYPEGVTYANPPARTAEEQARIDARVAALEALAPTLDYERARFHPIHFPPMIEEASNEECLVCHQEILDHKPRAASPAGVPVDATLAWYQTLDTYAGDQESFHYRHLESDFAKEVMNLECTFCHKGNDPREESPDMVPTRAAFSADASPEFTLRKMVNPSDTCLRCHGAMPDPEGIMGLSGPWHEAREDFEYAEAPNGCLSCHAETERTVRHNVDYLHAETIEKLAREGSSDTCYGCHGGRAWYRISYPYPRHAWPDMAEDIPEWAADRPTESDPEYALPAAAE